MNSDKALNVDDLAQEIRRVDGKHDLGAGALAEALMPFIDQAVLQSPEVKRLRRDAGRYHWLKANGSMSVDSFVDKFRVVDAAVSLVITDWVDSFDEAIDAAMGQQS